jgi:hypothetical protein
MQTISIRFEYELKKLIQEEIERLTDVLKSGVSIHDIADYKHLTGQLVAWRKLDDLCDEARSIVDKL